MSVPVVGGSSSEQVSTGLQVSLVGAGHGRSHVCCCLGGGVGDGLMFRGFTLRSNALWVMVTWGPPPVLDRLI